VNQVLRIVMSAFLVVTSAESARVVAQRSDGAERPNIVMIIADDQAYSDFGFMGNEHVRTPNIDRLASQSARYTNGYVPSSVCRPSLVTLLTGLYPHQHGVHFNHPPPGFAKMTRSAEIDKQEFDRLRRRATYLIRSVPTLPRLLAARGYRCLQTGKYWEGHWRNAGFTEGMTLAEPAAGANNGNKTLANGEVVAHGNGDHGLAIGRDTMQPIYDFIDDCDDTPYFIWYAPFLPHLPHDAPERFHDAYEDDSHVSPHQVPYYAACSQFDETVGQLVDYVEQKGRAEQTVFLFVSDNGFVPDAKRPMPGGEFNYTRTSKRSPFDDGLRTPILIRWDGRVAPAEHVEPCSSVDIVPTLLDAVGMANAKTKLPGRSLLPSAIGAETLRPQPVVGEIYPGDASTLGNPSRDIAYRWVRDGDLKLIVPHQRGKRAAWNEYVAGPALFDLARDPTETQDLSGEPAQSVNVKRLRKLLDDWWTPGKGENRFRKPPTTREQQP